MNRRKILIVDADEAMRRLLQQHLESVGYEVVLAESRQAALEVSPQAPYALALIDYKPPDSLAVVDTRCCAGNPRCASSSSLTMGFMMP